ncbi:hypothetical protein QBC40DRAFT_249465 [Triangularia verruculosa]|uniref:Transmembrane protein n=1 Tax=Triangularia verruculosa TaxID=2587418 RepID=A0AAN7AZ85_9PEZI|nr:hypothetical protein QBC40DRAFT_249465 [Triangularia verruculosa]
MAAQNDAEHRRGQFLSLVATQDPFPSTFTNPTHHRAPDTNDSDAPHTTSQDPGDSYQIQKWADDAWKEYEKGFEKILRRLGFEHSMEDWFSEYGWWMEEVAEWVRELENFNEDTPEEEIKAHYREMPELPSQELPPKPKASNVLDASTAPDPRQWSVWEDHEMDELLWFKNALAVFLVLSCIVLFVGTLWYLVVV